MLDRHVLRRANGHTGKRELHALFGEDFRDAEVHNLDDVTLWRTENEDVFGLEIAVQNASRVRLVDRCGNLIRQTQRQFDRQLAATLRRVLAEIFAVRDTDLTITSAAKLAAAISALGTQADAPGSVEATADAVYATLPEGAVVLVMGGGRSTELATRLAAALAAR